MAQLPQHFFGARAAGMGGAVAPLADSWALQYNIGALAEATEPQLAAGYQTRLNLPELSTAAVMVNYPLLSGVAGPLLAAMDLGPLACRR
ncbi:hypothetical protein ADICEAN_02073 [Cesiribacter andamanensis AMV16]|uniref:Uncharacterized protein n=1 Tax=Cesiribacter andamanensis AMV16 TaxID=1279009 RepID=M7N2B6_9BACT|nr:hypothetical protein ADICEAN_02073 [Cesiribacter andamanensis AMV16]